MNEASVPSDEAAERPPANQRRRTPFEVVDEPGAIDKGVRLESPDYGAGTVVSYVGIGWQVYWDQALPGTVDGHLLTHEVTYLQLRCRRL